MASKTADEMAVKEFANLIPNDYEVPGAEGGYMKFEEGENKFRILSAPIFGWEFWNEDKEGNRKPVRFRMDDKMPVEELDDPDGGKHFWSMPVWNFKKGRVQILHITQKTIQKKLRALERNEDWGSLLGYNVTVTKTGEGLGTEYDVTQSPHSLVPEEAIEQLEKMDLNLEQLFSGGDPFNPDRG